MGIHHSCISPMWTFKVQREKQAPCIFTHFLIQAINYGCMCFPYKTWKLQESKLGQCFTSQIPKKLGRSVKPNVIICEPILTHAQFANTKYLVVSLQTDTKAARLQKHLFSFIVPQVDSFIAYDGTISILWDMAVDLWLSPQEGAWFESQLDQGHFYSFPIRALFVLYRVYIVYCTWWDLI